MALLKSDELPLYIPFQYESKNPYETYMIIGTIKLSAGYKITCLILDRKGYIYCDDLPDIDFVKPASNKKEFIKSLIDKNTWDSEDPQTVAFSIAIGKDHRDQSKIRNF